MQFVAKNKECILIRRLIPSDFTAVSDYLYSLRPDSQSRFGPHPYDAKSIEEFYKNRDGKLEGYISLQESTGKLIAYSLFQNGLLEHEINRLKQYGLRLNAFSDATFAPSVSDEWQQFGIGWANLKMITSICSDRKIDRLFLWGGVQADNSMAIKFYTRNGFMELGRFEYNGNNIDMMFLL